jgi:hypothetical protein
VKREVIFTIYFRTFYIMGFKVIFFSVLGFEHRATQLLGRHSTT